MQYINALIELVPVYVPLAVMFAGLLLFFPLRAWFYGIIKRIRKSEAGERSTATDEPVTVVICCRDEGDYLERNLPAILGQKGVKFEVVVVDDCSTDSTPEVLKRYEKQYPNLKHTFVPKSARYVSHEKLAVTLGAKRKSGKRYRLNLQTERAILKLTAARRACRRQNARKCSVQTLL